MKLRILLALAAVAALGLACDGPTAGELSVELVTPNSGDGAILFKLEAPASQDFGPVTAACSGCQAFIYRVSEAEVYCVVTGPLTPGPLARITVADVGMRGAFSATILQVAGLDRQLRSDVDYQLRLSR